MSTGRTIQKTTLDSSSLTGIKGADGATIATGANPLPVSGSISVTGGATEATLLTRLSESDFDTKTGSLTETAPATDTASSGLNGRLQRIAQRLSSLIALLPTALGAGGGLKVDGSGTALPVSGSVSITGTPPLPTGASTATKQDAQTAQLQVLNSLAPTLYDYMSLGYTGSDLTTVTYKSGGSGGTTVSTLTMTYSAGILQTVTRTP
jgi:hypothetical protein